MKSPEINEEDDSIGVMISPVGKKAAKSDHKAGAAAFLEVGTSQMFNFNSHMETFVPFMPPICCRLIR